MMFDAKIAFGAGIGFRRDLADELLGAQEGPPHFVEFAPENWMNVGGHWGRKFREICEKYPVTCHGLSLSLGSPEELDRQFLNDLKVFFAGVSPRIYSEHLSYCKCDNAHLYDLLPIPFREDALVHVVERIKKVQDFLGRQIALENVSYYTPVAAEMKEEEFISEIVKRSDCLLLLDVNNVYVNAFNQGYDARRFISALPLERVAYIHMAGHEQRTPDLIIDTHGEPIIDPVFELFEWTLKHLAPVPVLLERDYNFPDFALLKGELLRLQNIIDKSWSLPNAA